MKKSSVFIPILSLFIGVTIGFHAQNNTNIPCMEKVENKPYNTSQVVFYDNMILNSNTIEIYDTSELTSKIMHNRNGKIIVEKVIGEVVNDSLDGKILNTGTNSENYQNKNDSLYINYERVKGAKQGDIILTYFIYNPFTKAQDDVMTRLDFIIDDNAI